MSWRVLPSERRELIFGQGVSVEDVVAMDTRERERAIRGYASKEASKYNKRINRMREAGLNSPAMRWVDETVGGRFGISGKDLDEVNREIGLMNRFGNMQTSGLRGTNKYINEMSERLNLSGDRYTVQERSSIVFSVSRRIEQHMRRDGLGHAIGTDEIHKRVSRYIEDRNSWDMRLADLIDDVSANRNELYEDSHVFEDDEDYGIFGDLMT